MSHRRTYLTLTAFKRAEPELSGRLFRLAKCIAGGFTEDGGREVPAWSGAVWWMCKMIQPSDNGSKAGADPLQVEHAMREYVRKPEKFLGWPAGPWGLMRHITLDYTTAIRVEEIRWDETKREDRRTAGRGLEAVADTLGRMLVSRGA
jgi:hypothetical protein